MKKRIRNLIAAVMALMMLMGGLTGLDTRVDAAQGDLKIMEGSTFDVKPGETSHIGIALETVGQKLSRPEVNISAGDAPFAFSTPKLLISQLEVIELYKGNQPRLEFDVTVSDMAQIGTYPVTINFTYKNLYNESDECSITVYLKISEEKIPAQLTVSDIKLGDTYIGSKTELSFTIKNEGEIIAKNVYLIMDLGDSLEADYTTKNIKIGDMKPGSTKSMTLPVSIFSSATVGRKAITANFTYKTTAGDAKTTDYTFYVNLTSDEKEPAQLTLGNIVLEDTNIGSATNLSFTINNEGELIAKSIYLAMDFGDSIEERYTAKSIKIGDIKPSSTKAMTLPVSILSSAATGRKAITANFTYKTPTGETKTTEYTFYVNLTSITSEIQTPKLSVSDVQIKEGLKPGEEFDISVDLKNIGGAKAENILVKVDDSSVGPNNILKNFYSEGITVKDIDSAGKATAVIPLVVSKYATGELKPVSFVITYTDKTGTSFTINETVYVDVVAPKGDTPTENVNLIISNVTQNPVQPEAGDRVEISFDIENKGNMDISGLKVRPTNLSEGTFIPVNSDPYLYYEALKAGAKIRVTVPLIVSMTIPEGLNNITFDLTYDGGGSEPVIIPVKNIKNESEEAFITKPKLIVSQYYADVEELRAGSTFNFTFELKNTNTAVTARNITVTVVESIENPSKIFSFVDGSDSFYISKIGPEETVSTTVPLKVRSDAATGAYKLQIQLEYEYDGLKPDKDSGDIVGEKKSQDLTLQVVENSRPVVDNVNIYSWEGMVTVGNSAFLSMEFYNMGKSQLNNVTIYVEGDFTKADGSMYFLGTVAPGISSYAEFEVIPNIEGTAYGILRVTFEDSNGDTVEFTKDFEAQIMAPGGWDGPIDGGDGEVFNPDVPMAKKPIVPTWAFILIQVAIFVLFVPITRKVIISVYKTKLRKKEQEQYNND